MTYAVPGGRLVLDLLHRRMGGVCRDGKSSPLGDPQFRDPAAWRDVIAFASAHFVLPALAEPLAAAVAEGAGVPDEPLAFLRECEAANGVRNAMLRDSLIGTAARLNELGVVPVALKGAAFLAGSETAPAPAAWRFMQDLDLLVPEERLMGCVAALRAQGFIPSTPHYDPAEEAHYPPLVSPCCMFSIELHTRLFARDDYGLSAAAVDREAVPVRLGGANLSVPAPRHRLMHALAHAQLHNRNFVRRRVVLKDVLDVAMLEVETGLRASPMQLWARVAKPHEAQAVTGLVEAIRRIMPQPSCTQLEVDASSDRWARASIERLFWPSWRKRLWVPFDLVRLETYRLRHEAGHIARRLRLASDTVRLSEATAKWWHKQRQYHWG